MEESPVPTKRARTSSCQDGEDQHPNEGSVDVSLEPFRHLQHVRFPPAILALPHVLKQIDNLLLSPEAAIVEAAATGQIDWLDELLEEYWDCFTVDAFEAAAANGQLEAVQVLYDAEYDYEEELSTEKFGALKRAVLAAAKKGYVDVVEYLLPLMVTDPDPFASTTEKRSLVQQVFTESAANGHIEVLKLMIEMERTKRYMDMYHGEALPLAIAAQHTHVVDFLLEKHEFDWSYEDAFEEAVARGQTATAEQIYNAYPQYQKDDSLFVDLAFHGRKDAVEYLYNNGCRDPNLVCDAFVRAAEIGSLDVIRFLHDTGLISADAFEKAWECAPPWHPEALLYLYGLKRASPLMIDQWFERLFDLDILKVLLENEVISDSSIVAAFSRAARCSSNNDVEIVRILYQNKCIASDAIDNAFVSAICHHRTDVVKLLQNDSRLTPKGFEEGFVMAVGYGRGEMVKALYDQHQVSPDALVNAFERAAGEQDFELVETIVKYLSADNVPRKYKLQAFTRAASFQQSRALEMILDTERGDWSIIELKTALRVAWKPKVKNFIREMICDQLFSGRPQQVRVSGDDGHVITELKWHNGE